MSAAATSGHALLLCAGIALLADLVAGRWRARRARELGFTDQGCEQRCWL